MQTIIGLIIKTRLLLYCLQYLGSTTEDFTNGKIYYFGGYYTTVYGSNSKHATKTEIQTEAEARVAAVTALYIRVGALVIAGILYINGCIIGRCTRSALSHLINNNEV